MSVTTRCPNCRQDYQVREENLGARATCKKCGQPFTVEMMADETVAPQPRPDAATPPQTPDRSGQAEEEPAGAAPPQPAPADAPAVPPKIGPYTVCRRLGGGAMGEVWLAWDPALQRDVAIKTLRPEVALSAQGLDRFLREARSAAKLHHTNAVTVYQVGVEGKTPYIAMEYVEGQSLDTAVSPGQPMAWREATRAVRDAAAGLAAAHKLGLIHRDVKPANLMRTTDGVTKVVDFGLARAQAAQTQITQQGAILGTPTYMAPEVWRRKEADARSDLYALACTYYCLLTGEPPFDADNPVALGYQHTHEPLPNPRQLSPGLPDGVCRILAKGARKDPGERYQSAVAMLEELEALLATPQESLVFDVPKDDVNVFSRVKAVVTQGIRQAVGKTLPVLARRVSEGIRRISRSRFGLGLAAVAAAVVVALGIVLSIRTGHGTVKIELSDPNAQVEVKVDGETIDITGLKEPLRLKAGAHDLLVESGDYRSVSTSFTVRRGGEDVLRVTLEPKAPAKKPVHEIEETEKPLPEEKTVKKPTPPEVPKPLPAEFEIVVEPADAEVTAKGNGVLAKAGDGRWKLTVGEPAEGMEVVLFAKRNGLEDAQHSLRPKPGERGSVALQLKKPPAPPIAIAPFDAKQAQQHQTAWAAHLGVSVETTNSIGMKLVLMPAGEFLMGSPDSDVPGSETHRVRITKPFYLGVHEVTQEQYVRIRGQNPSSHKGGPNWPIEMVSWEDAVDFCRRLSTKEDVTYRLPSEAEWEYACRAGSTTAYSFGDDVTKLREYGWCSEWSNQRHPVGQKRPNAWGLYDMHGNVKEWCADWYGKDYYSLSPTEDPHGPLSGQRRVLRGGASSDYSCYVRCAQRFGYEPSARSFDAGFRLARTCE